MITQLIDALSEAFESVVGLVTGGFEGVFDAVESLSSNVF